MPSQPPIPPLLSNHFAVPPESSLTLLTSVLGASSNWLLVRFLYSALTSRKAPDASLASDNEAKVVLVSWLRDWSFWKEGSKRLGVDLTKSSSVTFLDCLGTGLGLKDGGIEQVEGKVLDATTKLKNDGSKVIVILDGIDLLLAATETSVGEVLDCVGELREVPPIASLSRCVWPLTGPSCSMLPSSLPSPPTHPYSTRAILRSRSTMYPSS